MLRLFMPLSWRIFVALFYLDYPFCHIIKSSLIILNKLLLTIPELWSSISYCAFTTLAPEEQVSSDVMTIRRIVTNDLKAACAKWLNDIESSLLPVKPVDIIAAVWTCIECLAAQDKLVELGKILKFAMLRFSQVSHMPMTYQRTSMWGLNWWMHQKPLQQGHTVPQESTRKLGPL